MQPSGQIFFKDDYNTFYEVDWNTVGGVIDLTSTVKQPFVWGKKPEGFIEHGILFRKGIVTVHRQVLRIYDGGYEIVAEGQAQYEDFIQMNFPCVPGPQDPFKYHLNNGLVDDCEVRVTEGPRWADPDNPDDADAIWGDLDSSGNPVADLTMTGGADVLEFVDVWS